ncbi:hypothetical protein EV122DRAFT_202632 [Schizophyllum commune]
MNSVNDTLPPVHRLSIELLEFIFLLLSQPVTKMVTAHVCQYWRQITLGSPRICARICVNGYLTDGSSHLARAALARSNPIPVHIHIASRRLVTSAEEVLLWDDVLRQSVRWEQARLSLPLVVAMKVTELNAPLLRALDIGVMPREPCLDSEQSGEADTEDDSDEEDIIGPEFFIKAPLLTHATIAGTLCPLQIALPYAQLLNLSLQLGAYDDSLRDLIDVLTPCTLLAHLTVSMTACSGTDTVPFTLPALQVLDVNNQATELCRDLAAPSLHKIVFRMEHIDVQDPERYLNKELLSLLRLARRCGDKITSLTLRVGIFESDESGDILDRVLRALPGVTELETWEYLGRANVYEYSLIIDGALHQLYDPNAPLLPNLTKLSMHTWHSDWIRRDMDDIRAMVESRRRDGVLGRATLQYLELDQQTDLWPDDDWQYEFSSLEECERTYVEDHADAFEWMVEMRKAGLDIQSDWLDKFLAFKLQPRVPGPRKPKFDITIGR